MYPSFKRNGKYEISGGGYGLNLEANWQTASGSWVLTCSQEMLFGASGAFRVMPVLRYETGGETLLLLGSGGRAVDAPDGKKANVYETRDRRDVFNVNLSAALDVLDYNEHVLTVEMDITNLLDRKNVIDVDPEKSSCSMGRQVYMGLKYTF